MRQRKHLIRQLDRSLLERLARIISPNSAAAHCLAEAREHERTGGTIDAFVQIDDTFFVFKSISE